MGTYWSYAEPFNHKFLLTLINVRYLFVVWATGQWKMCYHFPIFNVCVDVFVFGECVLVFQAKALCHESTANPLNS